MAEQEWPEDRYHYTFSLSTTGGGGLPDEKPQEKPEELKAESTTYAVIEAVGRRGVDVHLRRSSGLPNCADR
jgi:hypothetical protein